MVWVQQNGKRLFNIVLPSAIPGILTGAILALSRAVGETAPLVVIGIPVIVHFLPDNLLSQFTAFQCKFMTGQNDHKQNSNMLHQQGFLY